MADNSSLNIGSSAASESGKQKSVNSNGDKSGITLTRVIAWVVIISFCFTTLITVLFLFALPVMMYEMLQSFFDDVKEIMEQYHLELQSGVDVFSAVKNLFLGVTEALFKNVWGAIKSFFPSTKETSDVDSDRTISEIDKESFSEDGEEMLIAQQEDAQMNTLKKCIEETQKAVESRTDDIEEAIMNDSSNSPKNIIAGIFKDRFNSSYGGSVWNEAVASSSLEAAAKTYYIYCPPSISVSALRLSQMDAARLMAIYTVVRGANIRDMRLSDYQKWLGYRPDYFLPFFRNFSRNQVKLDIGLGANNPHIDKWIGTCMPQYLFDQVKFEKNNFGKEISSITGKKSCAAIDLLLTLDCPNVYEVVPVFNETPKTVYVEVTKDAPPPSTDDPDAPPPTPTTELVECQVSVFEVTYMCNITIGKRDVEEMLDYLGIMGTPGALEPQVTPAPVTPGDTGEEGELPPEPDPETALPEPEDPNANVMPPSLVSPSPQPSDFVEPAP